MTKRRRFSEAEIIETLAWQGIFVTCSRCAQAFFVECNELTELPGIGVVAIEMVAKPEREHLHEIALDGPDEPFNCRYSCSGCHSKVTNGTKATSAGSSKQRIAKVKRLRGETKNRPKRRLPTRLMQSAKKAWPKRKMDTNGKIRGKHRSFG